MKPPNKNTLKRNAFLMFEAVFAILLVGIAFGIFAHFYLQNSQLKQSLAISDYTQEQILYDLKNSASIKQLKITGTDGKFCEGELLEVWQGDSVFKSFEPRDCDQSAH